MDAADEPGLCSTDDGEALRRLLIERGFVSSRGGRPLQDRRGFSIPWIYYGGEVNLSWRGLDLTASVLLDRLSTFSSTQIATYGISAIPLLAACVTRAGGRYSGLVIRKEHKPYGAGRKIDGPVDRARSVVLIDESISSGTTAFEAICALEADGLRVEGVVCVVEFSGYRAADWLRGRGYRVETVFDVWRDLERPGVARPPPPDPTHAPWSRDFVPPGLTPAQVCRRVVQTLSRTGLSPRPPSSLDADYAAAGGVFVSVRRRADDIRLVRAGFRRDDDEALDTPLDVVLAAQMVFQQAPAGAFEDFEALKFAVSFLDRPEPILAGQIDHREHALVVRGIGPLDRIGFALPNTPHYDDEIEQYRYARTVSANFWRLEPHALYRQRVQRIVEPGESWPGFGAPRIDAEWTEHPEFADAMANRLRQLLREALGQPAMTETADVLHAPERIQGVGVSIYLDGLAGCAISWSSDFDEALRAAAAGALGDDRYGHRLRGVCFDRLSVVVSLLLRPRVLGRLSADRLELFYRLGRDTLQASTGDKSGIVLAHFAVQQSLDRRSYQTQVLDKAGLDANAAVWRAYETVSWIVTAERVERIELGLPNRRTEPSGGERDWRSLANEIAEFVVRRRSEDGLPAYMLRPWSGSISLAGTATRILIALTAVLDARGVVDDALIDQAEGMVELFTAGGELAMPRVELQWESSSDAQMLSCLSLMRRRDRHRALALKLVARLQRLVQADGAIHSGIARMPADLDYLSGSVLLALTRASDWLSRGLDEVDLQAALLFYRRRFHLSRPWGMVWWHGQAWSALAGRDPRFGEFAFELVDWAVERQVQATGAFVVEGLEPERASFLTACVLEGVADAWACARRAGELERAERYGASWRRGAGFVERLTIRNGDDFFGRAHAEALGGVRATLASSELRIDYAGHALAALAKGLRAAA